MTTKNSRVENCTEQSRSANTVQVSENSIGSTVQSILYVIMKNSAKHLVEQFRLKPGGWLADLDINFYYQYMYDSSETYTL